MVARSKSVVAAAKSRSTISLSSTVVWGRVSMWSHSPVVMVREARRNSLLSWRLIQCRTVIKAQDW